MDASVQKFHVQARHGYTPSYIKLAGLARPILITIFLFALSLFSAGSDGGGVNQGRLEAGRNGLLTAKTVVLVADEWCPYNCAPNSDKPGYVVEIAELVFAEAGHTVIYKNAHGAERS